ncbi:MAG: hypothetical protein ABH824_02830 [Nanoarchaeota archaeon]|nr:hypothetical protein [Nanoarchaeota archaeon]MBU1632087.1 hypothetical protein [Nanoarchaeota archaeon]MBU1875721.1 hypothetical protein [Nanoarchaeota archaeon]
MRKIVIGLLVVLILVFIVGCVDYKAYDTPKESQVDESALVDEIAQIEKDLNLENNSVKDVKDNSADDLEELEVLDEETTKLNTEDTTENDLNVEEDVVLPELSEEDVNSTDSTETDAVSEETADKTTTDVNPKKASSEDTSMQTITVDENEKVKLNVKVTDPDEDNVTYTFTSPLNNNGEWKTEYGDAGEYVVTLTATDGKLSTKKKLMIVVNRVNVAPLISNITNLKVKEGATVTFEPSVTDPNKDPVTVTISEPLKNGIFVTDHTSAGEYQIKVVASDGELETEKSFKLVIEDVNVLPVITNVKNTTKIKEGDTLTIKPLVTDLDGDVINLTISEPVGNDGVWETSYTDHGEYVITITANDGKDVVTKKMKVTVEDINAPPEIIDVSMSLK